MLTTPPPFTVQACDARLKKWRYRLQQGEAAALDCWGNIDVLLEARLRLLAGETVVKPWETDEPLPEGA